MKVIHVVFECIPGKFRGGPQRMVWQLADAQAVAGADVEIWALNRKRVPGGQMPSGLRLRYFPEHSLLGRHWSWRLGEALALQVGNVDVVHSHNTFEFLNVQVARFGRRTKTKTFFSPHGALDPKLFGDWSAKSIKKQLYNRLVEIPNLNAARGVFAFSNFEESQLRAIGVSAPIHVVPNGVEIPPVQVEKAQARQRLGIAPNATVVLYLGRIDEKKNIHLIIRAFELVRARNPESLLIIAGWAQYAKYASQLDALVAQLGLESSVRWLGFVDEVAKPDVFSASDVFVHASESEGMALAILESMSYGIPTFVSPGCYMTRAAKAEAVMEVPSSYVEMGCALSKWLASPEALENLGQRGRNYVRDQHNWESIASQMLATYQE
jgi:glycosyltransferase involved in cell wall biosynthesis